MHFTVLTVFIAFFGSHYFVSGFKNLGTDTPIPVVLWHGMGDTCCNPVSMGSVKRQVKKQIPDVYVYSVEVGSNVAEDYSNSYFMNVNDQISQICKKIQNDDKLKDGYHAMGFSQGGQFLRALVQRCPNPPMRNLVTFGGQHQGVYGLPNCDPIQPSCSDARPGITSVAYEPSTQNSSVQAEYWHDPINETRYAEYNIFLADINNVNEINEDYKTNLMNLWNFVMIQFTEDTMVVPKESEWFGFYNSGQAVTVHSMENSTLYIEDRLGLKVMNEDGRITKIPIVGNHLDIPTAELDAIIDKYMAQQQPNQ